MVDKKIIVVYKSRTGFTERYAGWIAEALHCDIVCLENFNIAELVRYDVLILGGGIHAGRINGIKFINDHVASLKNKKIIVFATGATAPIPEEIERFRKDNLPQGMNIAFFYFQSGINYARMNGADRLMMTTLKTVLKLKINKSAVEHGTMDAIQNSYDYSKSTQIEPLVNYINTIGLE